MYGTARAFSGQPSARRVDREPACSDIIAGTAARLGPAAETRQHHRFEIASHTRTPHPPRHPAPTTTS
jgi:hypothetical protein